MSYEACSISDVIALVILSQVQDVLRQQFCLHRRRKTVARKEEKGKRLCQTRVGVKERERDFDATVFNCWNKNCPHITEQTRCFITVA